MANLPAISQIEKTLDQISEIVPENGFGSQTGIDLATELIEAEYARHAPFLTTEQKIELQRRAIEDGRYLTASVANQNVGSQPNMVNKVSTNSFYGILIEFGKIAIQSTVDVGKREDDFETTATPASNLLYTSTPTGSSARMQWELETNDTGASLSERKERGAQLFREYVHLGNSLSKHLIGILFEDKYNWALKQAVRISTTAFERDPLLTRGYAEEMIRQVGASTLGQKYNFHMNINGPGSSTVR